MRTTPMQRRYERFPRLMFHWRRLCGVNREREMALLDLLCDPARTSVDVGAKLGMYTHRLLRHSRDVVAFEPIPLLATMLGRVFRARVRVEGCALSDQEGVALLRVPFGSNGEVKLGRSTIEPCNPLTHDDVAAVDEVSVPVRTLDGYGLRGVGFVKVDVEGHELAVLRGALGTLARERPTLLVEANEHHQPDAVSKLHALMDAHGYLGLFVERDRLRPLSPGPAGAAAEGVENFLFVPAERRALIDRLAARLRP